MESTPLPVPPVRDYMSYFSVAKNNPFIGNYIAALAPYVIDVAAPAAAPAPADVSQKLYSNSPTDFLLWLVRYQ